MTRRLTTLLSIIVLAVLGAVAPAAAACHRPSVTQTPHHLRLGSVALDTSVSMEFTVTNHSRRPVTNTGFSLSYEGSAGFVSGSIQLEAGSCEIGGVLAPHESCTYSYSGVTGTTGRVQAGQVCYLVGQVAVEDNVCSSFSLRIV